MYFMFHFYVLSFSCFFSLFFFFFTQHLMVIGARLWHDDCYQQSERVFFFYDWNDISAQNELSQMMQELSSV